MARRLKIKINTVREAMRFLERVVAEGEQRIGTWGKLDQVRFSKLGDCVVLRRMNGEYVSNFDFTWGGTIVVRWNSARLVR